MSDQKFLVRFLYMPYQMQGKQLFTLSLGYKLYYYANRYFLDAPNVDGEMHIRSLYQYGK